MIGDVRCWFAGLCVWVHVVLCHQHVFVFICVWVLCALDPIRMVENHGTLLFPAVYEFHD